MKLDYIKITGESGGVMRGGNQSDFSSNVKRSGCGMIAACDVLLYKQNKKSLSESEYKHFICEKCTGFFYKHRINLIGVAAYRIVKFFRSHGYSFCFIPRRKLKGSLFEQHIKESLDNDTPVIVRVGLNWNKLQYRVTYTVNGRISQGRMSWHYITVTGMENDMLTYSSWGAVGEMPIADLQKNLGFMGGIILPDKFDWE